MIIEHPTKRYNEEETFNFGAACHLVECDFCGRQSPAGKDIEDTVEVARKAGFTTRRGETLTAPRKWSCRPCREVSEKGPQ